MHGPLRATWSGVFIKYNQYEKAEIKCDTIDLFVKENDIDRIDYLKIDTEGAELRILKGAQKMLKAKKVFAIQLEHGDCFEDAGYTIKEVHDFLVSFGFTKRYHSDIELLYTL